MSGIFRRRFESRLYRQAPCIPSKTASANIEVTPGAASLTLTTFAPVVLVSDHKVVTPGVAALTLTTFAPAVLIGQNVVPDTASLTITTFAATVAITNHITVIPGATSLTLTTFAPIVTVSDHKIVTPGVASLTLTTFAPTVIAGGSVVVTPNTASLTLTMFAPTVEVSIDDVPVIVIGGDDADAPRTRKRRKERREPFQEIEKTIHALLHPEQAVSVSEAGEVHARGVDEHARRAVDELLVLAKGQHDLIQRATALRAELRAIDEARERMLEQDEEDALTWMF